jgi:hypothetical protein
MTYSKKVKMPLVLLFLLCLFPLGISAQSTVKGIVNDETGQPIIGVTVRVVGTKDATVTDMDGKFAITASPKASLSFSYVGYNPQTVVINGRSNLSITLKEESSTLNDVVVIGYGTAKRSDISGSVTSVNTQTMMKKAPLNVAQGLQGAAAGVIVVDQDGAPSAISQVRLL